MQSFLGRRVSNRIKKEKKLIQLYVSQDKWELLRAAADSVDEPITTWVRRSIFASLRNWTAPAMKKENFPKCSVCQKHHNEQDHYRQD